MFNLNSKCTNSPVEAHKGELPKTPNHFHSRNIMTSITHIRLISNNISISHISSSSFAWSDDLHYMSTLQPIISRNWIGNLHARQLRQNAKCLLKTNVYQFSICIQHCQSQLERILTILTKQPSNVTIFDCQSNVQKIKFQVGNHHDLNSFPNIFIIYKNLIQHGPSYQSYFNIFYGTQFSQYSCISRK